MWSYNYTDELYHYGIKGMKWGIRRFENKSGHLTAAGKKRYDGYEYSGGKSKKPKLPTVTINKKQKNNKSEAQSKPEKSEHRKKLEAKYVKEGLTQKDAERMADRRIKAEKIVAGAAAITLTAAAAYAANKQVKYRVDSMIKEGTNVRRISASGKLNTDRALYTSFDKKDNVKYKGLYGAQLHGQGKDVKQMDIKAIKDIKIASRKHSEDVFVDLYRKDPEFRKNALEMVEALQGNVDAKGKKNITAALKNPNRVSDKNLRKGVYEAFNIGLVSNDSKQRGNAEKFYNKLKEAGYDAVKDINDSKYSGYNTKTPTIIFNGKGKLALDKVKDIGTDERISSINAAQKLLGKDATNAMIKQLSTYGAAYGTAYGAAKHVGNTQVIKAYRKTHPNSKMTDKEIIKAYQKALQEEKKKR